MSGTVVVVDSSALLGPADIGSLPIRVVELGVELGSRADTGEDPASEKRPTPPVVPIRTSSVAPGQYFATFSKAIEDGFASAVVLTLAASLSGTHQSATVAQQAVAEMQQSLELRSLDVHIVDSGTVVGGLALLALAAARAAGSGPDSVLQELERLIPRVVTYGLVSDWETLRHGGRVPVGAVMAGRRLGIHPCFCLSDGSIRPWRLPRSPESGLRAMAGAVGRIRGSGALHIAVFGDDVEASHAFTARFESLAPAELLTLRTNDLVAAHTGRGVIGVSAYREP